MAERSLALEKQYDFRWRHADREAILAQYADESARTVAERRSHLDLFYGPGSRERIDVFPAARAGAPVHVFIHGGYWRAHRKEDYRFVARAGGDGDLVTAVVEYDLAPLVTIADIIAQMRRAIAWVHRRAGDFNGDPARVVVSGHSAGGHLAAMLALTDWPAHGLPADTLRGCLAISGVFDLAPIARTSIDDDLRLDDAAIAAHSPIHRAAEGKTPIMVAYGADETEEFLRQSREFARALRVAGRPSPLLELTGLHHYNVVLELARPGGALATALRGLLGNDGLPPSGAP